VFRIPLNVIVFCLAFSVFDSFAVAISHIQTLKPSENPMKTDTIKKEVFHYTHDTAISTAAKIMKGSSEFVGLRFGIEKLVETGAYPKIAYLPPPFIYSKKEVNTLIFQKRKVWTIKPKSAKKQVILYLHGGGYVANLSLIHWDFIQEIVEKTNSIMIVPDYPLSPDFTYKELFNFMDELYSWISRAYPDCEIVFMGDSAGGGLSLAYAQLIQIRNQELEDRIKKNRAQSFHFNNSLLSDGAYSDSSGESVANLNTTDNFKVRMNKDHSVESVNNLNTPISLNIDSSIEKNIPTLANTIDLQSTVGHWKAPKKVILLSPWLDLGMKNPEAKPIAELDKILSFEVLKLCAQAYLGNKKPSDELLKIQQVSPINGPYLNNTEIAVFVGTHDLFFADSKKLKNQYSEFAKSEDSTFSGFQFYEYPQMFHVWMLFTKLPESQSVISQITEFLDTE
jgi:acetyl esterase/lipase